MNSKWMPILCVSLGLLVLLLLALIAKPQPEHSGSYESIEDGLKRFTNDEVTCYMFDEGVDCHWKRE